MKFAHIENPQFGARFVDIPQTSFIAITTFTHWRFSPVKFNRRINCSLVLTVLPETHFSLTAG